MYRQGNYSRKRGPFTKVKYSLRRLLKWWKSLPLWKKLLYTLGPIVAFLIIVPVLTYFYFYNDIADVDKLLNRNNSGVVLQDIHGKTIYSQGNAEHRDLVKLDGIAKDTQHALIASEDKDFYKHGGFSAFSIIRSMYANIAARGITGGGSTLTQQLAKNTLLTKNQTYLRKYQELTIAMAIEQRYSKDEILSMYLNSVYYGEGAFGIEDAAKTYFNTTPDKLDLAQSAMLIGILPAPSAYSPISGNPAYAKERQTTVLSRMVRNGYITEAQKNAALQEELVYANQESIESKAPHFTEQVLSDLYKKYGEEKVRRSGFQVTTTLDLDMQQKAEQAVASGMAHINRNGGSNASLVAIDPKTGGITAMVGSADYNNESWGKVNMATTKRQPGSSFKPIYYADALASGKITPTTVLKDEPTDFGGYSPKNASKQNYGNVTVRQALDWSLNIPAVKVMQKVGVSETIKAAKNLNITTLDDSTNYGLSLALGTAEVPLDQMTSAYSAYANGGLQYSKKTIESINDKYGTRVFTSSKESHRAISEQGAYLLSNILSDNQTRARMFGSSLNVNGTDRRTKTVAVKTGTTENARDAWTIGYTPDVAVGVWVGNNDNQAMTSGGSDMAGPIWKEMMRQSIGASTPSFPQPSGIVKSSVCTDIGIREDVFLSSKVPTSCQQDTKKDEDKETTESTETDTKKCTIAGKEDLLASDANCKEEMCSYEGLTDLAANDPKCIKPKDSDSDGVIDSLDQCPGTAVGAVVDSLGCSTTQSPGSSNGNGNSGNGNGRSPRGN